MSNILYYSKYCDNCKKHLQILSKSNVQKDIHFICIDKRIKDQNNTTYIVLDNGQKIILPEKVTKVPALLLLNKNYEILYGEQILQYLKPKLNQEIMQATNKNIEPTAFSLNGAGNFGNVVSDQYSYFDQDENDLRAQGNGGLRQMHNYVEAFNNNINNNVDVNNNSDNFNTTIRGLKKMDNEDSNQIMEDRIKRMKEERDADIRQITGNRPPISF